MPQALGQEVALGKVGEGQVAIVIQERGERLGELQGEGKQRGPSARPLFAAKSHIVVPQARLPSAIRVRGGLPVQVPGVSGRLDPRRGVPVLLTPPAEPCGRCRGRAG